MGIEERNSLGRWEGHGLDKGLGDVFGRHKL